MKPFQKNRKENDNFVAQLQFQGATESMSICDIRLLCRCLSLSLVQSLGCRTNSNWMSQFVASGGIIMPQRWKHG